VSIDKRRDVQVNKARRRLLELRAKRTLWKVLGGDAEPGHILSNKKYRELWYIFVRTINGGYAHKSGLLFSLLFNFHKNPTLEIEGAMDMLNSYLKENKRDLERRCGRTFRQLKEESREMDERKGKLDRLFKGRTRLTVMTDGRAG
jgi:hypothetical protein